MSSPTPAPTLLVRISTERVARAARTTVVIPRSDSATLALALRTAAGIVLALDLEEPPTVRVERHKICTSIVFTSPGAAVARIVALALLEHAPGGFRFAAMVSAGPWFDPVADLWDSYRAAAPRPVEIPLPPPRTRPLVCATAVRAAYDHDAPLAEYTSRHRPAPTSADADALERFDRVLADAPRLAPPGATCALPPQLSRCDSTPREFVGLDLSDDPPLAFGDLGGEG